MDNKLLCNTLHSRAGGCDVSVIGPYRILTSYENRVALGGLPHDHRAVRFSIKQLWSVSACYSSIVQQRNSDETSFVQLYLCIFIIHESRSDDKGISPVRFPGINVAEDGAR